MSFKTDAEIAQSSTMRRLAKLPPSLGLNVDNIEPYGPLQSQNSILPEAFKRRKNKAV